MKTVWSFLLLVLLGVSADADCLTQLAGRAAPGAGYCVITSDRIIEGWWWDNNDCDWKKGKLQGAAVGALQGGDGKTIALFPAAMGHGGGSLCTPEFLAKAFKILAHEKLHFCCGKHQSNDEFETGGDQPPDENGNPPDCNDLNYAMHTADAICDEMADVVACCKNEGDGSPGSGGGDGGGGDGGGGGGAGGGGPGGGGGVGGGGGGAGGAGGQGGVGEQEPEVKEEEEEEECEGLTDDEGNPIEGLERENLKEYCEGLANEHQEMQDRYNNEENANTAFDCACGQPPWTPADSGGMACCPAFPQPGGGCQGSAAETYPNNEIIPDCSSDCSDC